jgi:anthranilate synthase component 1
MTTFEEFKELSSKGNVIPVYETILADAETPVSVYLKIKDESRCSFLLESVEGGEKLGRYSFLGYDPFMSFTINGNRFEVKPFHDDVEFLPTIVSPTDHPLQALKKIFGHIKTAQGEELPRLSGGAVGYFGYETVGLVERVPAVPEDDLQVPDAVLLFYDVVLVFDNVRHQLVLVSNGYIPRDGVTDALLRKEYEKAVEEIRRLKAILRKVVDTELTRAGTDGEVKHVTSQQAFCESVERARRYIVDGDVFQVVLSQRLEQRAQVKPFDLYRTLRAVNPSPYMYFLNFGDFAVVGSSPEMLVRVERGIVETRPIAGTRRRGMDPGEDSRLEAELLSDPKERAEHLMLVDLGRNDLGRISEFGSVNVDQFMIVERYSHVMHLVSNVSGRLRKDLSALDALFSCFPAGTLSGAPKIRAMEIIAELEPVKRGVYGGAVAYVDFSGNLDSCIAIRTLVVKESTLYFQAGAGIVFDSRPEREYEETVEKLRANLKALEMLKSV